MDCSNLQSDGILERATIPGDTQILKLAGNAISDDITLKVIMESLESVYEAQEMVITEKYHYVRKKLSQNKDVHHLYLYPKY